MKTKIIPFDLETAKKIQAGEIKGCIKSREGNLVRIVAWDMKCSDNAPILALIDFDGEEAAIATDIFGKEKAGPTESIYDLVLEVPDNEPQFKPFDKVLVRNPEDYYCYLHDIWIPAFFQCKVATSNFFKTTRYLAGGLLWSDCIPYEGNEHLVGTTNNFV